MKHYVYALLLLCVALTSCTTSLKIPPVEKVRNNFGEANMEFLGFTSTTDCGMFNNFGRDLERNHIALNKQSFSMGIFTMENLETYPATMRYLSFVDILKLGINYNDDIKDNQAMATAGLIFTCTIIYALPLGLPLLFGSDKNITEQSIQMDAIIYVYDTQEKKIIVAQPVKYENTQRFKGQYEDKKTDKRALNEVEKNMLTNFLLEQYGAVHNYLSE